MSVTRKKISKSFLTSIILIICLIGCQKSGGTQRSDLNDKDPTKEVDKFSYEELGMGIVIDRVFKLEGKNLKTTYTNKDYENIKEAGFKHVRVPIREQFMNEEEPGRITTENLKTIKEVINQILRFNLIVVFNPVHPTDEFKKRLENEPELQKKFITFWSALATALKDYSPAKLLLEPFNEPHFDSPQVWYNLQERIITEIRKAAPLHTIIATPVTESIEAVTSMEPLKDENILYTFHFYLPFDLTHQGNYWSSWKVYPIGYRYPNDKWTAERIRKDFFTPLTAWAKKNNIKLYGGEFGVINNATKEDRVKWFQDVAGLMNESGYAGSVFEYKGGSWAFLENVGTSSERFDKDFLNALGLKK